MDWEEINMPWFYLIYMDMLTLIGVAMAAMAGYLLWKRRAPEARALALIMLGTAVWAIM